MFPKFCPKCGAPLKPGQEFCMECGTHLDAWQGDDTVEPEPEGVEEAVAEDDPTLVVPEPEGGEAADAEAEATEPAQDAPAPAHHLRQGDAAEHDAPQDGASYLPDLPSYGKPQGFEVIDASSSPMRAPVGTNPTESRFERSDSFWTSDKRVPIAIIAATAVLVLLIFLASSCGTGFSDPQASKVTPRAGSEQTSEGSSNKDGSSSKDEKSSSKESAAKKSSKKSSKKSKKTDPDAGLTDEEKTEKKAIKQYSDKLADYRSKVDAAVSDYKTLYTADRAQRTAKREEVQGLISQLQADQDANNALAYQETAPFYNAWVATGNCYNDLLTAARRVDNAWAIDLGFNYPSYYPETLQTPFEQSTSEGGDIYQALADYDSNYAQISFEKSA